MTAPLLMISYEAPPRLSAQSIAACKGLRAIGQALPAQVIDLVCASPGGEVPVDGEGLAELLPENVRVCAPRRSAGGRQDHFCCGGIIGGKGGWQSAAAAKCAALFPAEHKKPALLYTRSAIRRRRIWPGWI